ncbi:alpha-amylase [Streptomyces sp. NPDC090029]|uniref:alpha-amylase n=1 Tax=Streptomyces sp. NPDC090029 TaxID=3365924 RepID=UPI0037F8E070
MRPSARSAVRSAVRFALPALLAGTVALTGAPGAAADPAPGCVTHSSGWRYTFVTNGCADPQRVTVAYLDGTAVPCRTAAPGGTVTFPGYGTQGNRVLSVDLCPAGD